MTIPAEQAEAASLLARLTGAAPIETHISAVFVGPDAALKMKKAVDLGFLDFSALAARERFARRELALNSGTAPGLYRDVVPVTRGADGALRLGAEGEPVEWVLRMAPLAPGDFLDAVAARQGLDSGLLDAVADAVAAMHDAAPIARIDALRAMAGVLDGNRDAAVAAGLGPDAVAAWAAAARAALARVAPLLAARAAQGFMRRCHGDLHLGNLCLLQGRPAPFDALEFDEALATIDTGYDLAFLVMDLDRRAGRAEANRVLNRYVARRGDAGFLAALPLFLSLRAVIRAHVEARKGGDGAGYLAAATDYLAPVPPRLVGIGGLQGTGKSRLARLLASALGAAPGALVLRTDEIRKRRAGVAPEQRLPAAAYAPAESLAVHAALFDAAAEALAAGHAVIADAAWLDPAMRAGLDAVAARCGVPFDGLWLEAPIELLRARIAARRDDASDADAAVLDRAAHADPGCITWHRLDASDDPSAQAMAILGLGAAASG